MSQQPPPDIGPDRAPPKSNTTLIVIVVASVCLLGCCVIGVVAAIAIPNLIEARKGSNEAAAIGAMRTITTAQELHREGDKDRNGKLDYARSLRTLEEERLIDGVLGSGTKQGYTFEVRQADDDHWSATATPAQPGKSGDRSFFVDESGLIRFRTEPRGARATAQDQPIGTYGGR